MNSAILGPFMLGTILLLIGFRPRKPWVIHAHMNKMFLKVFLSIELAIGAMFVTMEILFWLQISLGTTLPSWVIGGLPLLAALPGILMMVYVLYWSQPFSHNRTGVKAVDEAVERYKKPKEGIVDLWVPALVVNGERYRNTYYLSRKKREWIVVNEQGKVLRDEQTAHTVRNMLRIALQIAHPEHVNYRTNAYVSSQKGTSTMRTLLAQYDTLMAPVREAGGKRYEDEIEAVKRAAEVGVRFQEGMCAYWLAEARWGNQRGGTKLKELTYEDWRTLIERLHKETLFLRDEIETLKTGAAKAEAIRTLMQKKGISDTLNGVLTAVIGQHTELSEAYAGLRAGLVIGYERGMDEEELTAWQSRLEWVDKVDAKRKSK